MFAGACAHKCDGVLVSAISSPFTHEFGPCSDESGVVMSICWSQVLLTSRGSCSARNLRAPCEKCRELLGEPLELHLHIGMRPF